MHETVGCSFVTSHLISVVYRWDAPHIHLHSLRSLEVWVPWDGGVWVRLQKSRHNMGGGTRDRAVRGGVYGLEAPAPLFTLSLSAQQEMKGGSVRPH